MELMEYIFIIKKRIKYLIILPICLVVVAGLYTRFRMTPMYASTASIIVGEQKSYTSYTDLFLYEKLVETYSQLAKSRTVSDVVRKNLRLDGSGAFYSISTSVSKESQFLTITAMSTDPKLAMDAANETAKALKEKALELGKGDNIYILDKALLPGAPYSPSLKKNIAIAFLLGVMAAVGIIFLIEFIDNSVKSQEDAEIITGVPVIGIIPMILEDN
jgi:capsular polysaccharide biosynthesis protein